MSNGTTIPPSVVPMSLAVAPFPEGFVGDMDETFQQFCALAEAYIEGNFLMGLVLPPGSTLPPNNQGPIAMGNIWYFWDPVTGQYLPQTVSTKAAKNFVKNPIYQVQQLGPTFTLAAGNTKTYDMVLSRSPLANVLAIAADVGPTASADNDNCPAAIKYTVGPALVPTPASTDVYVHEHLIEGADIAMLQGQPLSLSFSVWVNQPGTYSVYLASTGRDCSYVANFSVSTASAWTRIKVPGIPAIPAVGTWNFGEGSTGMYIGIPLCVGTQYQSAPGNLNTWQPALYAGSASNVNLCTVVNNQIKISGIKLEASPQVSYLSVPSFDADFWECLRYYYTTFNYQSVTIGAPITGIAHVANGCYMNCLFPRRMAKTPTVVPYGWTSHAAGNVTNQSSVIDFAIATLGSTLKGVVVAFVPTGTAKGDLFWAYITADARLS